MRKKKWSKPKLIILTRAKPEEMVLSGCKLNLPYGLGMSVMGCMTLYSPPPDEFCINCNIYGVS